MSAVLLDDKWMQPKQKSGLQPFQGRVARAKEALLTAVAANHLTRQESGYQHVQVLLGREVRGLDLDAVSVVKKLPKLQLTLPNENWRSKLGKKHDVQLLATIARTKVYAAGFKVVDKVVNASFHATGQVVQYVASRHPMAAAVKDDVADIAKSAVRMGMFLYQKTPLPELVQELLKRQKEGNQNHFNYLIKKGVSPKEAQAHIERGNYLFVQYALMGLGAVKPFLQAAKSVSCAASDVLWKEGIKTLEHALRPYPERPIVLIAGFSGGKWNFNRLKEIGTSLLPPSLRPLEHRLYPQSSSMMQTCLLTTADLFKSKKMNQFKDVRSLEVEQVAKYVFRLKVNNQPYQVKKLLTKDEFLWARSALSNFEKMQLERLKVPQLLATAGTIEKEGLLIFTASAEGMPLTKLAQKIFDYDQNMFRFAKTVKRQTQLLWESRRKEAWKDLIQAAQRLGKAMAEVHHKGILNKVQPKKSNWIPISHDELELGLLKNTVQNFQRALPQLPRPLFEKIKSMLDIDANQLEKLWLKFEKNTGRETTLMPHCGFENLCWDGSRLGVKEISSSNWGLPAYDLHNAMGYCVEATALFLPPQAVIQLREQIRSSYVKAHGFRHAPTDDIFALSSNLQTMSSLIKNGIYVEEIYLHLSQEIAQILK